MVHNSLHLLNEPLELLSPAWRGTAEQYAGEGAPSGPSSEQEQPVTDPPEGVGRGLQLFAELGQLLDIRIVMQLHAALGTREFKYVTHRSHLFGEPRLHLLRQ